MNSSEENECPICLETYDLPIPNCRGDTYREKMLTCGHLFHKQCIAKCNKYSVCPMCQGPVNIEFEKCTIQIRYSNGIHENVIVFNEVSNSGRTNMGEFLYSIQEVICIHRSYFLDFGFDDDFTLDVDCEYDKHSCTHKNASQ